MKKTVTAFTVLLGMALVALTGVSQAAGAAKTDTVSGAAKSGLVKGARTGAVKPVPLNQDQAKAILDKINKQLPNTRITAISKAPIEGLYEVVMGRNVAYVDKNAKIFLFGHMFDLATQQDLTQARIDEMTKVDFAKLPLDKAIKVVKGNGSRVFAVFTDPDCPYCKMLEQGLAVADNYTMYVFLYPIAELHPEAHAHAQAIWCAKDRVAAWHEYMLNNKLPDDKDVAKDCSTPLAELTQLGQSLGVNGTPTMIRKDGKLSPGAPQGPMLELFLSGEELNAQNPGVAVAAPVQK